MFLTAAKYGRLYGIDEYWSIYRKHMDSMMNSYGPLGWPEINIEHYKELDKVFSFMLEKNLCKHTICNDYIYLIRKHRHFSLKLKYLLRALRDVPLQFIPKAINIWILRKGL